MTSEDFMNGNTFSPIHQSSPLIPASPIAPISPEQNGNNIDQRPCSDPSTTTWENKDTNSIGSEASSSNESPGSDQASSVSNRISLDKLVKVR